MKINQQDSTSYLERELKSLENFSFPHEILDKIQDLIQSLEKYNQQKFDIFIQNNQHNLEIFFKNE